MSREETMMTRYGEMLDMIACMAISNGAEPKKKRKAITFDDALMLGGVTALE